MQKTIESLGYRKVCARWVPRLLTKDHKGQRKPSSQNCCGDIDMKTMIFCCVLLQVTKAGFTISSLKRNAKVWNGTICILNQKKEAKTVPSAAKVMGTVFWNAEGLILAEFLERGQTITAARYVQTLHELRRALRDKRPGRNIIILHDNARPHAARLTSEATAKMGWEVLPHPSYSPDLAPSDYHLFGFVNDQLRGQSYETTEAIQKAVRQCLRMAGTEF